MVDVAYDSLPYIKEEFMLKSFTLLKEGDVAFADASEDTNDVAKAIEAVNCNNQQIVSGLHTIHGRDNSNRTVIGYKGYAFASDSFHKQIRRIAQGTKVFSISVRNFDEVYIGIPSKEEQTKISKLLTAIDKRIATQNKIIERYESLIRGIMVELQKQGLKRGTWKKVFLNDILKERNERNSNLYQVFSVSVSQGIINQVDHLGRSFSAKDTSKYNVVHYGDLVYTKSPTGSFPYGIVKQSLNHESVAVSPLYGVYVPDSLAIGIYLHKYFMSEINTQNYLHPLIQKGAKNTINITNQHFLENRVPIPLDSNELLLISKLLRSLNDEIRHEQNMLQEYQKQKQYLLRQMFI